MFPTIYTLGSTAVSTKLEEIMRISTTGKIANEIGKNERQTRYLLNELEQHGFVVRIGSRKGWELTDKGKRLARSRANHSTPSQPIFESPAAAGPERNSQDEF